MYYEWFARNLAQAFDDTCLEVPEDEAVVAGGRRLVYRELQAESFQLAAGLRKHGVSSGSRVAAIVDSSIEFALTVLALHRLGAVLIPLNLNWTGREFVESFRLTEPDLLLTVSRFRGNPILAGLEEFLPGLAEAEAGAVRLAEVPTLRGVVTVRTGETRSYAWTFDEIYASGADFDHGQMLGLAALIDPETPALCLPTSGSTGFPKPVVHSHNSFLVSCACYADAVEFAGTDRMLNYGTPYHVSGQLLFFMPLLRGGSQVLMDWFEPEAALSAIERERITVAWGFDTHYLMMRRHPSFARHDISTLTRALMGSDPGTFAEIAEMGIAHHANIYGCSEYLSNLFPYRDRFDRDRMHHSHGRPMEGVAQKIVDPVTGRRVPVGTIGEICVKGPGLFKGYYKMPEQTAAAFDDEGYFHTGDFGFRDEAGYTYYRGRLKDTVKTGGENVSAKEVELFLQTETPFVRAAQVFGLPDPRWGEAVTAVVELNDGVEITEQELRAFCRGRLAGYKIPKRVLFVGGGDWVVTPTGKLDKQAMRSRVLEKNDGLAGPA